MNLARRTPARRHRAVHDGPAARLRPWHASSSTRTSATSCSAASSRPSPARSTSSGSGRTSSRRWGSRDGTRPRPARGPRQGRGAILRLAEAHRALPLSAAGSAAACRCRTARTTSRATRRTAAGSRRPSIWCASPPPSTTAEVAAPRREVDRGDVGAARREAGFDAKDKPKASLLRLRLERSARSATAGKVEYLAHRPHPRHLTLLVRRYDGLNWAVLFNTDANADGKPSRA